MESDFDIIKDETKTKEVRFVSFMGNLHRYDFAIMDAEESDKKMIINLRKNRIALIGREDLEEGKIEHDYNITEMEADELREFFKGIL